MSKIKTFDEFKKSEIELYDEISDIDDVLPDRKIVTYSSSGRTFSNTDYYDKNSPHYPNHKINQENEK